MSTNTFEMQATSRLSPIIEDPPDAVQLHSSNHGSSTEVEMRSLSPTDHGKQAYLVLAGCTLIQAPVWGYSLAFGVFQEYYTTHPGLQGSVGSVATVGTTLNGLMYLMSPITFTVLTRYPCLRPYCGPLGLAITVGSLILSSYATKVWHLIASQGVLCAIGSGLLYAPTTLYLDEWFIARKGMAYGTIGAGKSAAGVVFPFLMSSLLSRFGPRTTLQAWAVSLIVLAGPLLFFLKPRIPISRTTTQRPISWTFLSTTNFWMLQAGNVIEALGYLLPTTYLGSYTHSLGLPSISGAVLIAVLAFAAVPGSLIHGLLGDRLSPPTVILISSLGAAASVFIFWGLAAKFALLVVFVLLYGFFAGGFSSTYPGIVREMKRVDEGVDTGLVMGLLLGARGLGFVVGGPVSGALLGRGKVKADTGYATEYGMVIVCTGISALLGGWAWIWKVGRGVLR